MTTIVKHRRTGNEYILLSINGEADRGSPSRFISELFEREKSAVSYSATLCDVGGNMFLAYIDDLIVIEVDGVKPADVLPPPSYRSNPAEENPNSEYDEADRQFDDDFDEEFEDDEFTQKPESQSQSRPQVEVIDSLDAPSQDSDEDEEKWI